MSKNTKVQKEKNATLRKVLGIISLIALIANIVLRFTNVYGDLTFWIIIIVIAVIAWPVMNWLKK